MRPKNSESDRYSNMNCWLERERGNGHFGARCLRLHSAQQFIMLCHPARHYIIQQQSRTSKQWHSLSQCQLPILSSRLLECTPSEEVYLNR